MVTPLIFKKPFEKIPEVLYYGLPGISKTFSWILYNKLSGYVAEAAFKSDMERKYFVPKLVYFNVNPEFLIPKIGKYGEKFPEIQFNEKQLLRLASQKYVH